MQKTESFESFLDLNGFVEKLYERVFRDINCVLRERGEKTIPPLDAENMRKAFAVANPHADIHEGGSYVIYGAGNNAYKVQKCLNIIGGRCIYLTDSNQKKWGTLWNGIPILSFEQLLSKRSEYQKIIIASPYFREMEQTLMTLGMRRSIDFVTIRSFPND